VDMGLVAEADGEIVVHRLVVQEVLFDRLSAIAQTKHKITETVVGVCLHDVPEDGSSADLHHWLRTKLGFFPQARAEPAA